MWLRESSSCSKHRVFYTRYLTTQRALSDKNTLTHKSSFQFWTAPFQGWTRPRCRGSGRGRGRTAAAPAPLTHTLPCDSSSKGPDLGNGNMLWEQHCYLHEVFEKALVGALCFPFLLIARFLPLSRARFSLVTAGLPAALAVRKTNKQQKMSTTACRTSLPFHNKEVFHKNCLLNHQKHLLVTFGDHNMFRKQSHGSGLRSFRNPNK